MRWTTFFWPIVLCLAGCSPETAKDEQTDERVEVSARLESRKGLIADRPERDLGVILAQNQIIQHTFTLRNEGAEPIRLARATALTPCCSAVERFTPGLVDPGESSDVGVSFKPGHQTGGKRIIFLVESDPKLPALQLALSAELVGEWEMKWVAGSDAMLPANRPGLQRFQVVCRRLADQGRGAPAEVSAGSTLGQAEFVGATVTRRLGGVIEETTREGRVTLPSSPVPGNHHGELSLRWPDGRVATVPVLWNVVLPITASPAGLVIDWHDGTPIRHAVVIRSSDRPFRVLGAIGPLATGSFVPPSGESKTHRLDLAIAPGMVAGVADLRIATDHPDQSEVTVSVLNLSTNDKKVNP